MTPQDAIHALSALRDSSGKTLWSQDKIARQVNVTQGAIHKIGKGVSPRYETGHALIELAKKELAKANRKEKANGTNDH